MNIISLLVCIAMLFSGGYTADDPNAAAAAQITVRDLAISIQGEDYSLSPSVTFGASSENGETLIDLFMTLGDQILFPVQAKIDDAGAGVLLGSSNTAYTFTPELFDELMGGEEIPEEVFTLIDSYSTLVNSIPTFDSAMREEMNLANIEKILELAGDVEITEATFTADETEQTGKHFAFELDSAAIAEWAEYSTTLMPEDYAAAYNNYLKATLSLAGETEADSFSDYMALSGMDMSISGEITYNETSSVWDIVYHTVMDQTAIYLEMGYTEDDLVEMEMSEPIAMDMPMTIIYHNPDLMECVMTMEQDGVSIDVSAFVIDGGYITMGMSISEPEVAVMDFAFDALLGEDGLTITNLNLMMDVDGTAITLVTETVPGDEITTTTVGFGYSDEAFDASVSFFVDETHEPVADRISAANVQTISSMEEMEGAASTGLTLAAMSMMGDVEKLLNDESIAAIIPVFEQFFGASEDYSMTEVYTEESATEVIEIPAFAEPQFNVLPEGYSMMDSYYDSEYGCYSYIFTHADDVYGEYVTYVDIYSPDSEMSEDTFFYQISGGAAAPIDGEVLSVSSYSYDDFAYTSIWGDVGGYYVSLTSYDTSLSADALANIIAGIAFGE